MVPKVSKWGFWGGICIKKWSKNFDSGSRSAIFGTPKTLKMGQFGCFWLTGGKGASTKGSCDMINFKG